MDKIIITVAILLASTAAAAQTGTVGPSTIPGETREQKLAWIAGQLRAADTNGDEKIALTEWTEAGGKTGSFAQLDTNRDDILTNQELRSNARKLKAFADFQAAAPH